jgi:Leucine Rich repeat
MRCRLAVILSALLFAVAAPDAFAQAKKKGERSPAEKAAIAAIRKMGGHVQEIAQNDSRLEVAFHLADGKITDKNLVPLKDLKDVYELNLRGTDVTDAGLKYIAGLKSLKKLHLEKTRITDKGLAELKGLDGLEWLNVYGTQVSNDCLPHVKALKGLKKFYIFETKVTIDGVAKMKKELPKLQIIPDLVVEKVLAEKRAKEEAKRKAEEAKKPKKKTTGKKKNRKKKRRKKKKKQA